MRNEKSTVEYSNTPTSNERQQQRNNHASGSKQQQPQHSSTLYKKQILLNYSIRYRPACVSSGLVDDPWYSHCRVIVGEALVNLSVNYDLCVLAILAGDGVGVDGVEMIEMLYTVGPERAHTKHTIATRQ
jgi:hypothetical protein